MNQTDNLLFLNNGFVPVIKLSDKLILLIAGFDDIALMIEETSDTFLECMSTSS